MINALDTNQLIAVGVNLSILVVSLVVSGILIYKIKFDDKNYRLLFIIYTLYWIAPMLLREYTSKMHTAMSGLPEQEWLTDLMWVPVTVYGIIGLFWKPLNDLLSHRLKSRKNVIFIALGIQAIGAIPMLAYPCFATNIIQSITVGIGASGIAVFNLMFNEQYAKRKVFVTVSLLSLPPLIAEFFSSVLQCCVTSFLPSDYTDQQYIDIVKFMWLIGLIFIAITIVCTFFLKEKTALLYKDNEYKEPVNNKWDGAVVALLIFAAAITSFIKFCTSGGTAISEFSFIGWHQSGVKGYTSGFEGYLSVIFTIGQMAANILTGLYLVKKMNKWAIFSIASGLWIIYSITAASVLNVWARLPLNIINGFAFGMTYNLIVGIVMNKFFAKTNKITPVTLYNTGLSIGITSSLFFNTFLKQVLFSAGNDPTDPEVWNSFVRANWIVMICVMVTILVMWAMFTGAFFIDKKHPPQKVLVNRVKNQTDMDD